MKKTTILLSLILMLILTSCGRGNTSDYDTVENTPSRDDLPLTDGAIASGSIVDVVLGNVPTLMELEGQLAALLQDQNSASITPGGNLRMPLRREAAGNNPNLLHGVFIPGAAVEGSGITSFRNPIDPGHFDSFIAEILSPPLLAYDGNRNIIFGDEHDESIIVTADFDRHTITKTFRDGISIFWHDGVPVTMDDILFMYERAAYRNRAWRTVHAEGGGNHPVFNVIGATEFSQGEADFISGITVSPDRRSMTVAFINLPYGWVAFDDIISVALPRHQLGDIPPGDFHRNYAAILNVIGYGPFRFESLIPNVEVVLSANENYWRGRPHLDYLTFQVLALDEAREGVFNGTLDFVTLGVGLDVQAESAAHLQSVGFMSGFTEMYYFILGETRWEWMNRRWHSTWIPRDDDHPITNPLVRRAIAYAIDEARIAEVFGNGIRVLATSVLSPWSDRQAITDEPGLSVFDLDLANELMDIAGYDWGPHGFRQTVGGAPIVVTIAIQEGPAAEFIFNLHRENFAEIGIDLQRATPRYGHQVYLCADSMRDLFTRAYDGPYPPPNADIALARGISTGNNPLDYWNPLAYLTVGGRYVSDEIVELHEEFNNVRSTEHRNELLKRWDEYFNTHVPAVPSYWTVNTVAVNRRVTNLTATPGTDEFWRTLSTVSVWS